MSAQMGANAFAI